MNIDKANDSQISIMVYDGPEKFNFIANRARFFNKTCHPEGYITNGLRLRSDGQNGTPGVISIGVKRSREIYPDRSLHSTEFQSRRPFY